METQKVIDDLVTFREARDWDKFHTLAGLSRALSIEASEVEKVFLWKENHDELSEKEQTELKFELADVLTYAYYMCDWLHVDPNTIVEEKLKQNQARHWQFEEK